MNAPIKIFPYTCTNFGIPKAGEIKEEEELNNNVKVGKIII